ncbi:hypothetical protein DFH06DRAFT_1153414 [Mycena polygramma]|nr:hypothetical protein DFH06DRAFT_1153414 [Mycena polygramma]
MVKYLLGSSSQIPPYAPHISQLPDEELDSLPTRTEYLYEEFKNSSHETPLAHRCGELVSQSLTKFNFLDLGDPADSEGKRFRLRQTTVSSIIEVMELLQLTIDEMCKLTRARKIYQVDPKGVIGDALTKGRDSIKEMMWAHHFLKTRLDGGVRTIDKLYLRDSGYNHNSPTSSSSSLWAGFDVLSPNSRLTGFMTNPAVLRSMPDEADSKTVEEAFTGLPEKDTARFWNRLTGQVSIVGASSYGLGEDWEPPVNYFQGRSNRRTRSGGGANEVRFEAGPSTTRDESSYVYQEVSTTPLASSQPPLPSNTPARQPASGFLATSTPFAQGAGRSGTYNDTYSFTRQSPPHMSRTNAPPPAAAAGGEQAAFVQNASFQTGLPGNTAMRGNATHDVGDASLINFLDQGGLPVKDIGVPIDNILPPVQRRFSSRPSLPGGGVGIPPWNTNNVNLGLAAQAPLNNLQIPEEHPLPGGGLAPPPPPVVAWRTGRQLMPKGDKTESVGRVGHSPEIKGVRLSSLRLREEWKGGKGVVNDPDQSRGRSRAEDRRRPEISRVDGEVARADRTTEGQRPEVVRTSVGGRTGGEPELLKYGEASDQKGKEK